VKEARYLILAVGAGLLLLLGSLDSAVCAGGRDDSPEAEPSGTAGEPVDDAPQAATSARKPTDWEYSGADSRKARVKAAETAKKATVEKLFSEAGVSFPPARMLFRVFKAEDDLEVWAASKRDEKLVHVATYRICYKSGEPGPKRRQGDLQVPEGFYYLDMYNDHSAFYLSMRINYPNASDKVLGYKPNLGSAIMIHGNCVSIGCLAMSDERIQELWVMTNAMRKKKRKVRVHLYPGRDMKGLLADDTHAKHHAFWRNLLEGRSYFETHYKIPRVKVDREGRYLFE